MPLKSAKIPGWAHANAVELQGEIVRRGLAALPDDLLQPIHCPRCGLKLEKVALEDQPGVRCSKCGYEQIVPGERGASIGHLSVGHLLGLGVAALWREMDRIKVASGSE